MQDRPLPEAGWSAPESVRDKGAKRIRSHYLPAPTKRPPGLSTTTSLKSAASLSTINAATMRLCRADHPCHEPPNRGWSLPSSQLSAVSGQLLPCALRPQFRLSAFSLQRGTACSLPFRPDNGRLTTYPFLPPTSSLKPPTAQRAPPTSILQRPKARLPLPQHSRWHRSYRPPAGTRPPHGP